MIENKSPLHPPLPLLGLLPAQYHHPGRATPRPTRGASLPRPRQGGGYGENTVDKPKDCGGVIVVTGVGWFPYVAEVGHR